MAKKVNMQAAAQRRFKGKYAGPDKYKGVIPEHLKSKYKGIFFGKDAYMGTNLTAAEKAESKKKRQMLPTPVSGGGSKVGTKPNYQLPNTNLPSGSKTGSKK